MKITVFGAAGDVGSRIATEALSRGHTVSAVVRNANQFKKLPTGAIPCIGDAMNSQDVSRLTSGQDLIISALRPPEGQEQLLVPLTRSILDGAIQSKARVLIVGGAASLKMPGQDDITVLTAPDFLPDDVVPIAQACFAQHETCLNDTQADWTYLNPPAMLTPGKRTGAYRLGHNELMLDANGNSAISMEDLAVVLLDEAENPKHSQVSFTAAY